MSLPQSVVSEDQRLEKQAESASVALARLRWHWTLDESNSERVSLREYAAAVGHRDHQAVYRYAKAHAALVGGAAHSIAEGIERAGMSAEREAVAESVAEARGVGIGTVRKTRSAEIRRVREIARERAEKHGTTVEEEAPKVAEMIVKVERMAAEVGDERATKLGPRLMGIENDLEGIRRLLVRVLGQARLVHWGEEEQEVLRSLISKIQSLLNLVNLTFAGAADVDWDAELARLTA